MSASLRFTATTLPTRGRRRPDRASAQPGPVARQFLLERKKLSLPKALERIGGIQAQYAPSMYIGLWLRLERFERGALERRAVVQGTLMRLTIHLVSARDWWPFAVATREARQRTWLRHPAHADARPARAAARRVRKRLANGPMHRKEIEAAIDLGQGGIYGVGCWVDMVRVPPSGTWERRRADLFAAAEDWIGPEDVSPEDALDHAVRSYLRGFGPASKADVADYLGLGIRALEGRSLASTCAGSGPRTARSCSTCHARRCPTPGRPRPSDSCRRGCDAARACAPHGDLAGLVPRPGLQREDASVDRDVPR